jgi:hypothetical protein
MMSNLLFDLLHISMLQNSLINKMHFKRIQKWFFFIFINLKTWDIWTFEVGFKQSLLGNIWSWIQMIVTLEWLNEIQMIVICCYRAQQWWIISNQKKWEQEKNKTHIYVVWQCVYVHRSATIFYNDLGLQHNIFITKPYYIDRLGWFGHLHKAKEREREKKKRFRVWPLGVAPSIFFFQFFF